MAYVQPTATIFKARHPEFTAVPDALVNLVLAEAINDVGETWYERDRARAQMLLTAHKLTMEGEPGRSNAGAGAVVNGTVKRSKVGDVEVEFSDAVTGMQSGFRASIYGQQFESLMRKNFPPVAAV